MKKKNCSNPAFLDEDCREKLERIQNVYTSSNVRYSIRFGEIADCLTPQVLEQISEHPLVWMPLVKLSRKIANSGKFDFWLTVFRARAALSPETLLKMWYECCKDKTGVLQQVVDTPEGPEVFGSSVHAPDLQASLAFTNPLLIDNSCVTFRYCQIRKPGWEILRYRFDGRSHRTLPLAGPLREGIDSDSVPGFRMLMDMTGQKFSFSLLYEIIEKNACDIFRDLLMNGDIQDDVIPLAELAAWITMAVPDEKAPALLAAIEEKQPGFLKNWQDPWGRNLLWYAVYNPQAEWFLPGCALTQFLKECGCDPENRNQLGFSWRYAAETLPSIKKSRR